MRFAREFAERHAFIAVFFLLVVLSAICYHKTLSNGFVQDDIPSIVENPAASTPIDIAAVFTKNAWGDRPGFAHIPNYRPLTTLTYALTEAAAGQEPFAFHLVNLFLHALVAFLLFIFALELFNLRIPALIGAALFAVHPLASEAVCGAVNREELLCAVFSLAGLLVFLKAGSAGMTFSRFAAVSGCFALALLSKENAVTFPLAVLMTDLFLWINRGKDSIRGKDSAPTDYCRRRILSPNLKRIASYLSMALILTGYFALRLAVLGSFSPDFIPPQDNPLAGAGTSLIERILTPFAIFREMVAMFLSPVNLTVDYGINVFPTVKDIADGRFLTGLALFALYSAGLVFFWRRKSPLFIPLALILAAFSIFSNSFVLSSIIFAERILYLPLAFFTVFLGGFVFQVYQTMISGAAKTIIALFFFTICVVFALIAINRSYDWSDEFRLYKSSLVARPDSARLSVNIGKILMERNDFAKAKAFLTRSVDIDPECAEAHNNLSLIAMRAGDFKTTYSHLKKALEINPQNGKAWNNLCGFFISQGRFQEACEACKRALSLGVRTMHYDALMLDGLCR